MRNPKYKKDDILQTFLGKVFIIKDITELLDVRGPGIKKYYLLEHHPHASLPVDYIDNSKHIFPATMAAQVLYGKNKKT